MLPIGIPQSFFKKIKTILIKYIWQNKKPRIKFALGKGNTKVWQHRT